MPELQLFREYDAAFVARFHPATVTVDGKSALRVTVPGVANPVPIGMQMPAEWYTTFGMPAISITRGLPMPAPARALPAFVGREVSGSTANTVNLQKDPPQAVNIPYSVELIAASTADANNLTQYLLTRALPLMGFGTLVTVLGRDYPFRNTSSRDYTNYETKEGRLYRHRFEYVVEGWLFTLDCQPTPMVLSIDMMYEAYRDSVDIQASPPPAASTADDLTHVVIAAP